MAKKDEMKKKAGKAKAKAKTARLGDKSPKGKKFTSRKPKKTITRKTPNAKTGGGGFGRRP